MRIIKPQQLAVIKSGYQLGRQSYLGFSVVAGCWLQRKPQFTTESQIWQAWQQAPHQFPYLDDATPKPFAEFLLAGHVHRPHPVQTAEAAVTLNQITRRWHLKAARDDNGEFVAFNKMPLNHSVAANTSANPWGSRQPTLFMADRDEDLMVAPGPIPADFPLRNRWIKAIHTAMQDEDYRENIFPGMPVSFDTRYYQLASAAQQLATPAWPAQATGVLHGFSDEDSHLSFTLPNVEARAWIQRDKSQPAAVDMPLKTIWLLPDQNVILLVFTGSVAVSHMLDNSITALLVGLEDRAALRPDAHFLQVMERRCAASASPFEFMYDPDLMPEKGALDAFVPDDDKHGHAFPCDPAVTQQHYVQLRALIDSEKTTAPEPAIFDVKKLATLFPPEPIVDLDAADIVTGKRLSQPVIGNLTGRTFSHCQFVNCRFSAGTWQHMQFENCTFESCRWQNLTIHDSRFSQCHFYDCRQKNLQLTNISGHNLRFKACQLDHWHSHKGKWEALTFDDCRLCDAHFSQDALSAVTIHQSALMHSRFEDVIIQQAMFVNSTLEQLKATHLVMEKSSALASSFVGSHFSHSTFNSVTFGQRCDFSSAILDRCQWKKVGLAQSNLRFTQFTACAIEESSFERSQLNGTVFVRCDLTGVQLQQAQLNESQWQMSSLQQACLYGATLNGTTFHHCNLSGANLARVERDAQTAFAACLLQDVCWLPRRDTCQREVA
ncbi:MAG TPA: hypothetical protein DEO73_07145 [Pantoea sp.]|nr:hypothetical protein [Pantoea sp.]